MSSSTQESSQESPSAVCSSHLKITFCIFSFFKEKVPIFILFVSSKHEKIQCIDDREIPKIVGAF